MMGNIAYLIVGIFLLVVAIFYKYLGKLEARYIYWGHKLVNITPLAKVPEEEFAKKHIKRAQIALLISSLVLAGFMFYLYFKL